MKYKLLIELEVDECMFRPNEPDEREWFEEDILKKGVLSIFDNGDIGDDIGKVNVLDIIEFSLN